MTCIAELRACVTDRIVMHVSSCPTTIVSLQSRADRELIVRVHRENVHRRAARWCQSNSSSSLPDHIPDCVWSHPSGTWTRGEHALGLLLQDLCPTRTPGDGLALLCMSIRPGHQRIGGRGFVRFSRPSVEDQRA